MSTEFKLQLLIKEQYCNRLKISLEGADRNLKGRRFKLGGGAQNKLEGCAPPEKQPNYASDSESPTVAIFKTRLKTYRF